LLGTISDGDIRRAILAGVKLDSQAETLLEERKKLELRGPITASVGAADNELLHQMSEHGIRQIPLLDSDGRVVDMAFMSDLVREYETPLSAVVMAGGFGKRLRPLTDNLPKPMLPVGDRPILQRTIEQLKKMGVNRVHLTTHYRPEAISRHFGDGEQFGVKISYVHEAEPLGTAGALGLVEEAAGPMIVINGDILTHVDFRAMLKYHRKHNASLTVGVRQYDVQVPYGVIESDGPNVCKVSEKPRLQFLVNAGIYLVEPSALRYVPSGRSFDMPDLIQRLVEDRCPVVSFPIVEYWIDVGRPADYAQAQEDVRNGRIS